MKLFCNGNRCFSCLLVLATAYNELKVTKNMKDYGFLTAVFNTNTTRYRFNKLEQGHPTIGFGQKCTISEVFV